MEIECVSISLRLCLSSYHCSFLPGLCLNRLNWYCCLLYIWICYSCKEKDKRLYSSKTYLHCGIAEKGVLAGKSGGDEEKCLEDQLRDAKIAVGTAGTELIQLKAKIGHCEKELKERKSQLMSKRQEAVEVENELAARKNDVERAQKTLESSPYKEGHMEALEKLPRLL